jgi:hypothetical protein
MAEKKTSVDITVKSIQKKGQDGIFGRRENPDRHRKLEGRKTQSMSSAEEKASTSNSTTN